MNARVEVLLQTELKHLKKVLDNGLNVQKKRDELLSSLKEMKGPKYHSTHSTLCVTGSRLCSKTLLASCFRPKTGIPLTLMERKRKKSQ